jgi:hypothetical protein
MPATNSGLGWPALTVWAVVNAVNLLQAAGFLSRLRGGDLAVNHRLGYAIMALALPAAAALLALARARAGWLQLAGPAVLLAFVALMAAVDYLWPVEFRAPARPAILGAPYLILLFPAASGYILGLPKFHLVRSVPVARHILGTTARCWGPLGCDGEGHSVTPRYLLYRKLRYTALTISYL